MSKVKVVGRRAGSQLARVGMLAALIALSGVVIGLAAAYPLQFVHFEESDAVQLDQAQLAGRVEPTAALVTAADLPTGWNPGDPALAGFGILGSTFCGDEVPLPTALSRTDAAVWSNPTDRSTLVSQAVRTERWQSARQYVEDVADALATCDAFFRVGFGAREKVLVKDAGGQPLVSDSVRSAFVSADGKSVVEWSIMAVGDVLVAVSHNGPTRPSGSFLNGVERDVLARVAPSDFAPSKGSGSSTTTPDDAGGTTVLQSGSADETGDSGGDTGGAGTATTSPTTAVSDSGGD